MEEKISNEDFNRLYVHDAILDAVKLDYKNNILEIELNCYIKDKDGSISKRPSRHMTLKFSDTMYYDFAMDSPHSGTRKCGGIIFECKTVDRTDLFSRMEEFKLNRNDFTHYQFIFSSGNKLNVLAGAVYMVSLLTST